MANFEESLSEMVENAERQAFEEYAKKAWAGSGGRVDRDEFGYLNLVMDSAWSAWMARASLASKCRGVRHPGCDYLAPCGSICNKCGTAT